jgi:hypothetical protein
MKRRSTSKKDALLASTARVVSIDKGDMQEMYTGKFLGYVNVSSPKGDDVVAEALQRIQKAAMKPVEAELRVWQRAFSLKDVKSEQCVVGGFLGWITPEHPGFQYNLHSTHELPPLPLPLPLPLPPTY